MRYYCYTTIDEYGRTGELLKVVNSKKEANKIISSRGWYGGEGRFFQENDFSNMAHTKLRAKELLKERDKYKAALKLISQGPKSIDWSYKGYLELTAGEVFQNIAKEALEDE